MPSELSRKVRQRLDVFSTVLRRFALVDREGIGVAVSTSNDLSEAKLKRLLSPLRDDLPQGVTVQFLAESMLGALTEPTPATVAWREQFNSVRPQLSDIPSGREHASKYHKHVYELLHAIFDGALTNGQMEQRLNTGSQRVDIMFDNTRGVFSQLASQMDRNSPYVPFECKNYAADLGNPEYDQLSCRLNPDTGHLGVLVFREIGDWDRANVLCQAKWKDSKAILLFDDADLMQMYIHRYNGKPELADNIVSDRFRSLMFNVKAK